jgi:regulator of sigma E protease
MSNEEEKITLKNILILIAIVVAIIVILVFFQNSVAWNIVVLLLILTVLIFVHEFGHFIVAKKCGVHVHEFALGMGPKVCGFRRKNDPTAYSLRALPIGGYCQMAGEEGEDDSSLPKDKFMCNKTKIQRTLILVAGVTMNFITAIILLFMISLIWGHTEQRSYIGYVEPNSPASEAGITEGDRVISFNGHKISTWDDLTVVSAMKNKNNEYVYVIKKSDGTTKKYNLTPVECVTIDSETIFVTEDNTLEDIASKYNMSVDDLTVSKVIGISSPTERKKGFVTSLDYAFTKFGSVVKTMLAIVGNLITGNIGLDALSGPVGMYTVVNTAAKYGLSNIIFLMAYLSINLGVLNILPFPAFDGGRLLFVIIEAIIGRKVDARIEGYFHTIGFILIMMLMLYITFQDILNLF